MRFTPTSFFAQTGTLSFSGGVTGSYTSGGINYGFTKFTSSATLVVGANTDVDIFVVGGGGSGDRTGGGGGGILYTSTKLYKGTYDVKVGLGGVNGTNGQSSSISANGYVYQALGGTSTGLSGEPTQYSAGANSDCGGANLAGGGGASAAINGYDSTCIPSATGGNGGEGLIFSLDGTPNVYSSGGGGRGRSTSGGFASGGGGGTNAGNGGSFPQAATSAVDGFGGGGGGGYISVGNGGSGTIIIRYKL
jgi:hypothetical protein